MEIHVYDTYVKAADGHTMHFDVITKEQDHEKAIKLLNTVAIVFVSAFIAVLSI